MEHDRRTIGDRVLLGRGVEFGAGVTPSRFAHVTELTAIDKRAREELEALFGAPVDYELSDFDGAMARQRGRADFITAHHVLEHCANPIGTLKSWLPLLRVGGCAYFSVPSFQSATERLREPTPIEHLLNDYLNDADGSDYDSRQHIPEFVNQWTAHDPASFWFAGGDAATFAREALAEQSRREGHDLHWHTYTLATFRQVIETAFYAAGMSLRWGFCTDNGTSIHCVAHRAAAPAQAPAIVRDYLATLRRQMVEQFTPAVPPAAAARGQQEVLRQRLVGARLQARDGLRRLRHLAHEVLPRRKSPASP